MADLDKPRVLVLGGPTASGKTALSVALAKRLQGEILAADSMQIYEGLVVGTAQPTAEEQQGVPHHLFGFLPPETAFSVAEYVQKADACIREISARGRLPIVVGGTGLYISSLVQGLRFAPEPESTALRQQLQAQLARDGTQALYAELQQLDPEAADGIHPNNVGRVLRALERYRATGRTMREQKALSRPAQPPYDALLLCLNCAERAELYARIDARVDEMARGGLEDEARRVWENRTRYTTAAQAIGYKELFPYFEGTSNWMDCLDELKKASRHYAKRQQTWFAHMENVHWLTVGEQAEQEALQQVARRWPDRID